MALDWMRISTRLEQNPKFIRLVRLSGQTPEVSVCALYRLWSWFAMNGQSGHVHECPPMSADMSTDVHMDTFEMSAEDLAECVLRVPISFIDALVKVGWLVKNGDVFALPEFSDYQNTADARQKWRAQKAAQRLKNKASKSDTGHDDEGCPQMSADMSANVHRTQSGQKRMSTPKSKSKSKNSISDEMQSVEHTSSSRSTPSPDDVLEYLGKVNGSQGVMVVQSDLETLGQKYLADRMASGWVTRHGIPISDWISDLRGYAIAWTQHNKSTPQAAKVAYSRNTGTANDPELKKPLPVYTPEQLADFERQKWEILGKPQPTTKQP